MARSMWNMRLSREERDRLEQVAGHYGISAADVVRMLVKREHDTLTTADVDARLADLARRHLATLHAPPAPNRTTRYLKENGLKEP